MARFLFTNETRFPASSTPPNHSGFRVSLKRHHREEVPRSFLKMVLEE